MSNSMIRLSRQIKFLAKELAEDKPIKKQEEWKLVDKHTAATDFVQGKEIKLVWPEKPEGIITSEKDIADFFGVSTDEIKLADVVKFGYPHKDLQFYIKNKV